MSNIWYIVCPAPPSPACLCTVKSKVLALALINYPALQVSSPTSKCGIDVLQVRLYKSCGRYGNLEM